MKKKMYKAFQEFYYTYPGGKDPKYPLAHRLMILPKGQLGADGVIMSEMIRTFIGKNGESIEYRFVKNDHVYGHSTADDVRELIKEYLDNVVEKFGADGHYASICLLGIDEVPTVDEIRKVLKKQYPFNLIDIYYCCAPRFTRIGNKRKNQSSEEEDHPKSENGSLCPNNYQKSIGFGNNPTATLWEFYLHYIEQATYRYDFGPSQIEEGMRKLVALNDIVECHQVVQLMDKVQRPIKMNRYLDPTVESQHLQYSKYLSKALDSTLVHYMVYNYWHRIDESDMTYVNFVGNCVTTNIGLLDLENPRKTNDLSSIDPMHPRKSDIELIVLHEMDILRDTMRKMRDSAKVVSKMMPSFEISGKSVDLMYPVVVQYETSLDKPLPYEALIANYIRKNGYVEIPATTNLGEYTMLPSDFYKPRDNVLLVGPDPYEHAYAITKIDILIGYDPTCNGSVVRYYNPTVAGLVYVILSEGYEWDKGNKIVSSQMIGEQLLDHQDFIFDPRIK